MYHKYVMYKPDVVTGFLSKKMMSYNSTTDLLQEYM